MRVVTANIRDNPDMPVKWVREDVAEVRHLRPRIVFWQEIGEKEDHDAIEQMMGPHFRHTHQNLATPISLDKRFFNVLDSGTLVFHKGVERTTPTRRMAWNVVELKKRPLVEPFIVAGTHWVSGAWNDELKYNKDLRRELWNTTYELARRQILNWNDHGFPVLLGGDLNRKKVRKFTARQQWLVNGGIDKLAWCPAPHSVQAALLDTGWEDIHSDHHARWADIRIRKQQ